MRVTATPLDADANAILQAGWAAALDALIDAAELAQLSLDREALRLAKLDATDYDLQSSEIAKRFGIRLGTLARCSVTPNGSGSQPGEMYQWRHLFLLRSQGIPPHRNPLRETRSVLCRTQQSRRHLPPNQKDVNRP